MIEGWQGFDDFEVGADGKLYFFSNKLIAEDVAVMIDLLFLCDDGFHSLLHQLYYIKEDMEVYIYQDFLYIWSKRTFNFGSYLVSIIFLTFISKSQCILL